MMAQGYRDREQRAMEARAWVVAHLLQPWGFKGQPKDLLPSPNDAEFDRLLDPPDPAAEFDAMVEKQRQRKAQG